MQHGTQHMCTHVGTPLHSQPVLVPQDKAKQGCSGCKTFVTELTERLQVTAAEQKGGSVLKDGHGLKGTTSHHLRLDYVNSVVHVHDAFEGLHAPCTPLAVGKI